MRHRHPPRQNHPVHILPGGHGASGPNTDPPAILTLTTQPSSTVASGVVFPQQPVVQVRNSTGTAIPFPGVVITASITSGTGTLQGSVSVVSDANGVGTFTNLAIGGGSSVDQLRFGSANLTPASATVTVTALATKLGMNQQPSAIATTGVQFAQQPRVQTLDASSNPVADPGVSITAAIGSGSGVLNGTLTQVTDSTGLATFTDLSITGIVTDTLQFTGGGLTPVSSSTIVVGSGGDTLYFASNETPLTNAVQTADFRNGDWYSKTSDQNTANGTPWPTGGADGLGWGGSIFGDAAPALPAAAIVNLQSIGKKPLFGGSNYAATTGVIDVPKTRMNQRNNAWHNLSGGNSGGYSEIYHRCYVFFVPANYYGAGNPSADYLWGGQKFVTLNRWGDDSGIYWGGLGFNTGAGSRSSTGTLKFVNNHGTNVVWNQNQGVDIDLVAGNWYYVEQHHKLNTNGSANGTYELWVNNGGPTGDFSAQSPTLRARYTNVDYGFTSSEPQLIGNIWCENWSPNDVQDTDPLSPTFGQYDVFGSAGEQFWRNIHIVQGSRSGPIGFTTA